MSKGLQIAIATLTVCAAGAWLIIAGSAGEGTFKYYGNVGDYLHASSADAPSGDLRVHGFVVAGSIEKRMREGHVDFRIADAGDARALAVSYQGIDVPDLFGDGAEVVVEGHMEGDLFLAQRVLAKCPSKYEVRTEA